MTSKLLRTQLEKLEADTEAQREEIRRRDTGRNNSNSNLIPVVAANEAKIEALKKAVKDAELAEQEREKYLANPENVKKLEKKQNDLLAELDKLNVEYCQEGQRLLDKIKALHNLDNELLKMRQMTTPGAGPLIGNGRFTQLFHLEQGLNKAAEVGRFVAGIQNMRKGK